MPASSLSVSERIASVRARIAQAAAKGGRTAEQISLVAVTKGVEIPKIQEAAAAGLTLFGENRIQEAQEKITQHVWEGIEWQLVGHLQSNKADVAVQLFPMIQSVDSVKLAKTISQIALAQNKTARVLLEVNLSGAPQRFGFSPEGLYGILDELSDCGGIRIEGLMGIAPHPADEAQKRKAFSTLKGLFGICKMVKHPNIQIKTLSMGMSDDFEMAIEEGSNMVRIGRAIFQ